jgi:hypothetical protein
LQAVVVAPGVRLARHLGPEDDPDWMARQFVRDPFTHVVIVMASCFRSLVRQAT